MARGVGAFIEGAFGGYGWGENLKDRRRDRARADRLDQISEEQRAIENRRNDLRDRIMQDEHSYNQALREQQMADEAERRAFAAAAAAATDEARTRGATPRPDVTIGGPAQANPAVQPGATPGAGIMASGASAATPQNAPKNALTPKVNMGQSPSEPDLEAQAALAAADELVRRAEESRDPASIQRALAARNALRERILGPGLQAQPTPAAPPLSVSPVDRREMEAMAQPDPAATRAALAAQQQAEDMRQQRGQPPLPATPPASRGASMAFADTPPGSMPAAPRTIMGDIERRNELVNQPPRSTGPEQFIPGTDMIPSPRAPNLPLPMDNGSARPGVRGVPISAVMPPAVRQQMQDAAPAVADRLEDARLPSTVLAADTIRAGSALPEGAAAGTPTTRGATPTRPQARPTEGGASLTDLQGANVTEDRPSAPETEESYATTYARVGVPILVERFLRAGRPDMAEEWLTWAESQTARDGYKAYGRAVIAQTRGDIVEFADAIQTLYDSDYFPDGFEVDRKTSRFFNDEQGNIVGAQVVLRNTETGEMRVENYETIDEFVDDLLVKVSPEAAFAAHLQRQQDKASRAQEQIIERQASSAEMAQAIRDQLKVLEETRGLEPEWRAMTPEQRVAEAAAIVRASQAAAESAANTLGAAPTVTQGVVLDDWPG